MQTRMKVILTGQGSSMIFDWIHLDILSHVRVFEFGELQ